VKKNHWYVVRRQSLAIYARNAGFDLAIYHKYPESVQEILRKRAIREALRAMEGECAEQGFEFSEVDRGVYVIALSNPLSIQYRYWRSRVIYIGMGNIVRRIKAHLEWTLFDFMLDLSGANFDFYFACPARQNAPMYYKHVEYLMLKYFNRQYGGLDDQRRYPILNKNSGSNRNLGDGSDWWKRPLKAIGRKPQWELTPTDYNDYAPLDQGE
jgi:hypothetical protein